MIAEKRRVDLAKIRLDHLVRQVPGLHTGQPGRAMAFPALHQRQPNMLLILGRMIIAKG